MQNDNPPIRTAPYPLKEKAKDILRIFAFLRKEGRGEGEEERNTLMTTAAEQLVPSNRVLVHFTLNTNFRSRDSVH